MSSIIEQDKIREIYIDVRPQKIVVTGILCDEKYSNSEVSVVLISPDEYSFKLDTKQAPTLYFDQSNNEWYLNKVPDGVKAFKF